MPLLRLAVVLLVIAMSRTGTLGSRSSGVRLRGPIDVWLTSGVIPGSGQQEQESSKRCCCDSDIAVVVTLCKWVKPKSSGRCPELDLGRGLSRTHHALGLGLMSECPSPDKDEARRVYTLSRQAGSQCCCDTELGLDDAVCKYVQPNWRGHCPKANLGRGESQTHLAYSFRLSCHIPQPDAVPDDVPSQGAPGRKKMTAVEAMKHQTAQTKAKRDAVRSQLLFAQVITREMENAKDTMNSEVARVYGSEIRCCCDTDLGLENVKCKYVAPNWRGKCPKANLGRGYSQTHFATKNKLACDVDEAVRALWERRSRCCCDTDLGHQGAICRRTMPKWNGHCPVADFGRGKSQTHQASSVGLVCRDGTEGDDTTAPARKLNKDRDTCLANDALDLSFAPLGAAVGGPEWLARWPLVLGTPDENIYIGVTSIQVHDLDAKVLIRKSAGVDNGFEYEIMGSRGRELAVGSLALGIKMDMPGFLGSLADWAFGDKAWALHAEMRFSGHASQDEEGKWHFIQSVNKMKLHTKSWLPLARVVLSIINSYGGVGNMVFHNLEVVLAQLLSGASKQEVQEQAKAYADMGKRILDEGLTGVELQGVLLQHEFTLRGNQETQQAPLDLHIEWQGQTIMKQDTLWTFVNDKGFQDTILTELVSPEERVLKRRRVTAAFRAHLRDGLDLEIAPSPQNPSVQCFTGFFCASPICRPAALGRLEMQCPHGEVITGIAFASLGTPQGTCSDNDLEVDTEGCDVLPGALGQAVLARCQGREACTLEGGEDVFDSFLPSESLDEESRSKCPDVTHVQAAVQIQCSSTALVLDAKYAFGPADTYKVFLASWTTMGQAVKLHRPSQFNRYKDTSFMDMSFVVSDSGKYDISLRYRLDFGEREHELGNDLDFKVWALTASQRRQGAGLTDKFSIPVDIHLEYDQVGSITQRSKPFDNSVACCCDVMETDEEMGHEEEVHCAWLARGSQSVCPTMDLGSGVRPLVEAPFDNDNLVQLCASLIDRFAGVGDGTKVQVHAGRVDLPVNGISSARLLEATHLPIGSYTLRIAVPFATLYLVSRDLIVDHVLLAKSPSDQKESLELPKSLTQALLGSVQGPSEGSSTIRLRGPVDASLDASMAQDLTTLPEKSFPRKGEPWRLDGPVPSEFTRPFSDSFADRNVYRIMKMAPDLSVTGAFKLAAPRDEDQAVVSRIDLQADMKLDLNYMLKKFANNHGQQDFGYIYKSGPTLTPSGEILWALLNCGVVHLYKVGAKPDARPKPYVSAAVEDLRMCDATTLDQALACTEFLTHRVKTDLWCIKLTKKRQMCVLSLSEAAEWTRAIHLQRRRFDSNPVLTGAYDFGTHDADDTIFHRTDPSTPEWALIDLYAEASALQ